MTLSNLNAGRITEESESGGALLILAATVGGVAVGWVYGPNAIEQLGLLQDAGTNVPVLVDELVRGLRRAIPR